MEESVVSLANVHDQQDDDEEEANPLGGFWLEGDSLAPPCQADLEVVAAIMDLASRSITRGKEDLLYDLGCGDGRICLAAAKKFGCRAKGVEIEEKLIRRFDEGIQKAGLGELVTAMHCDLRTVDISDATVVVLYLLPESIEIIKEKLIECLSRGCTLICNTWGPKGLTPSERVTCGPHHNVTLLRYCQSDDG